MKYIGTDIVNGEKFSVYDCDGKNVLHFKKMCDSIGAKKLNPVEFVYNKHRIWWDNHHSQIVIVGDTPDKIAEVIKTTAYFSE